MHNFVYLAQRRIQEFSCERNFGGGGRAPRPLAAPLKSIYVAIRRLATSSLYFRRIRRWNIAYLFIDLAI